MIDDPRWHPGIPVLDPQAAREAARPVSLARFLLRPVPETRPTRLPRDWGIYLSVVAFVAGAVAVIALDLGAPAGSPIVRLCVLVGTAALVVVLADATVRIWRSAWAWMPVDRVKGVFRLVWLVVPVLGLAATIAAVSAVLVA